MERRGKRLKRWVCRDIGAVRSASTGIAMSVTRGVRFHVDHWDPLALDGADDAANMRLLCPACNMEKRALPWHVFLQKRRGLLCL